jgi:hypothetical protein
MPANPDKGKGKGKEPEGKPKGSEQRQTGEICLSHSVRKETKALLRVPARGLHERGEV